MLTVASASIGFIVLVVVAAIGYLAYRGGIAKALAEVEAEFHTAADDIKAAVVKLKAKL